MGALTLGVIGSSGKADERRVPIHPDYLPRIAPHVRKHLLFEEGDRERFSLSDSDMATNSGGVDPREDQLATADTVIIAKPVVADLEQLREDGVLWAYVHCAQQHAVTQTAID